LKEKIKKELNIDADVTEDKKKTIGSGKAMSKIDTKITNEMNTVMFEKQKKDIEESIRRKEEKKKKVDARMKELAKLTETRARLENEEAKEEERLKKEIEKRKLDSKITKEMKQSKILELKKELIEIELKQQNILSIFSLLKDAENVDICFLIDCTGSMEPVINDVKNNIHKIINILKKSLIYYYIITFFL
jgi:hypothetical protein